MEQDKFIIIELNTLAPGGALAFDLLRGENECALVFDSEEEAREYIQRHGGADSPFAYAILNTSEFEYEY